MRRASAAKQPSLDGDSRGAQLVKAFSGNFGIGVAHGGDHTFDPGSDQGIRAGRRATLMAVRFKIDIDCAAARAGACLLQSKNFGVLDAIKSVEARAREIALAIDDHGTNARARRGKRQCLGAASSRAWRMNRSSCCENAMGQSG